MPLQVLLPPVCRSWARRLWCACCLGMLPRLCVHKFLLDTQRNRSTSHSCGFKDGALNGIDA
jgi:hypothetical protein